MTNSPEQTPTSQTLPALVWADGIIYQPFYVSDTSLLLFKVTREEEEGKNSDYLLREVSFPYSYRSMEMKYNQHYRQIITLPVRCKYLVKISPFKSSVSTARQTKAHEYQVER